MHLLTQCKTHANVCLRHLVQSLVQARKAGIASAMAARSSFKDEELVSAPFNLKIAGESSPGLSF